MNNYYIALGDSITTGYGVSSSRNFAAQYYSYLLNIYPGLHYINYGIPGLTTNRLVYMLSSNSELVHLVKQARVITLTIGSNDLLHAGVYFLRGARTHIIYALSNMERNLEFIGMQIRRLNPRGIVEVATIYNPLPAGPYYQYSGPAQRIITQANKTIVHWAKKYGFRVVPVDRAFQGREQVVIGPDYIHPNSIGHQIVAMEYSKR